MIFRFLFADLRQNIAKHSLVFLLFSLLVAILFSAMILSKTIQNELNKTIEPQADLVAQSIKGGRVATLDISRVEKIAEISGIEKAIPRIWGYYNFESAGKILTIVGLNLLDDESSTKLQKLTDSLDIGEFLDENIIVGSGVKKLMDEFYFHKSFPFYTDKGELIDAKIAGVFKDETSLETNDLVLISSEFASQILNYDEDEISDIAIFVPNKLETPVIARKIRELYPDMRIIQKSDIEALYSQLYDQKSGFFMMIFSTVIISFLILLFYKSSALLPDQKREIGVLRAVGWSINTILFWKLMESSFVAICGFLSGFVIAIFYLTYLDGAFMIDFFVGNENLKTTLSVTPSISFGLILQVFLFAVMPFIAASLLPAWKAATEDSHEVLR